MSSPNRAIFDMVAAYLAAAYAIRLPGGRRVVLRVGTPMPRELDMLLARVDASAPKAAGLITAWNPFSRPLPTAENRRRQRELLQQLRRRSTRVFAGAGYGPDWREPSLAAFGITLAALDELARRFEQNAILAFRPGEPVRLRLYRDDWRTALAGADVDFAG
jgi:hypothetical protein